MDEEKKVPTVDSTGLSIGGEIKEIAHPALMGRKMDGEEVSYHTTTTDGKIVVASCYLGEYDVVVRGEDGVLIRSYSGGDGSDAAKVFNSHAMIWLMALDSLMKGGARIKFG